MKKENTEIRNIKNRLVDGEKFREKSKTNSIQYFSTEQSVQHMLQAGIQRQIMSENLKTSYEVDRNDIEKRGIDINDYRASTFDIIDTGRGADETIRAEIQDSSKSQGPIRSQENAQEN